ncbi:hypothetical protein ACSBR2_028999 [Camellia fascicularis]
MREGLMSSRRWTADKGGQRWVAEARWWRAGGCMEGGGGNGLEGLPWKNLMFIDLHSNLLQGPLPVPPTATYFFFISNNKLTGEIPTLICNLSSLEILDLSNNNLSGLIPQCLGNLSNSLSVLNLGINSFHGTFTATFTKGNVLTNLNLNGNQIEGQVPRSLLNCEYLEVLDLGKNKINDTFPQWLETLTELQVLVLRFNRFHGHIGTSKTKGKQPFPKLRIIDISCNEFTGLLPTNYIKQFGVMNVDEHVKFKYMGETYYQDSVVVVMKGNEIEYSRILIVFSIIDFSRNKFQGEISKSIGRLNSLRGLNLSHNNLKGHIPTSLGNLKNLESLDLSSNKFVREIPQQLKSLMFLEVLNLSNNQLAGPIPQGSQFNTFGNDSYSGNLALCGFPLSKKCKELQLLPPPPTLQQDENSDKSSGFNWQVVVLGYRCGFLFGMVMGYLMFVTRRLEWLMKIVEGKHHKKVKRSKKGEIPTLICSLMSLEVLDLSNNSLSGVITQCLGNISINLSVLSLRMNSFRSIFAAAFAKGNMLRSLYLNDNQIEGHVPRSLLNCRHLEVIDLGKNKINDTFPHWLETLPELQILFMYSVVNIGATALVTKAATTIFGEAGVAVLLLTEITPKSIAVHNATEVARFVVRPVAWLSLILYPVGRVVTCLSMGMLKMLGLKGRTEPYVTEDELKLMLRGAELRGTIEEEEQDMIENVLEIKDTHVREVMTPLVDVVAIDASATLVDFHNLVPVFEQRVDNIVGIAYAMDLLDSVQKGELLESSVVGHMAYKLAYFVPDSMSVWILLREFRIRKVHMAVVLNEYGGTIGIVTLEDVVEEIVGEIFDENDSKVRMKSRKKTGYIVMRADGIYDVDANTSIDQLSKDLNIKMPEHHQYETVSGFICEAFGYIPRTGETIKVMLEKADQEEHDEYTEAKSDRQDEKEKHQNFKLEQQNGISVKERKMYNKRTMSPPREKQENKRNQHFNLHLTHCSAI